MQIGLPPTCPSSCLLQAVLPDGPTRDPLLPPLRGPRVSWPTLTRLCPHYVWLFEATKQATL